MKKAVILCWGAVFALIMFSGSVYAADKFAYVDLSRIFSEYNKTKDYDKILSNKETVYSKQRDTKVTDIKQLQDKMNLLSDKQKEKEKSELEKKIKVLQEFDREKQTDLRKEQDEKMKELLKDIEATVKKYAEKEGYLLVFNDRVLVYQKKSMDITDKIIKLLNKSYKK